MANSAKTIEVSLDKAATLSDATEAAIAASFQEENRPPPNVERRLRPCHLKTGHPTAPPLTVLETLSDSIDSSLEDLGLWQKMAHHVVVEIGVPELPRPSPVTVPASAVLFKPSDTDVSTSEDFLPAVQMELHVPSDGTPFGMEKLAASVTTALKLTQDVDKLAVYSVDASDDGPPVLVCTESVHAMDMIFLLETRYWQVSEALSVERAVVQRALGIVRDSGAAAQDPLALFVEIIDQPNSESGTPLQVAFEEQANQMTVPVYFEVLDTRISYASVFFTSLTCWTDRAVVSLEPYRNCHNFAEEDNRISSGSSGRPSERICPNIGAYPAGRR